MLVTSSGGPIRSEKMDSSTNNLTPLRVGPEPVLVTTKIPSRKERLARSAMSSEKRFGQALMMEGGIQSAEEALAGQDARILWISVALTG